MKAQFKLNSEGSILLMAAWCLSVLAFFSVSLAFSVKEKALFAKKVHTPDSLYSIAYSGLERARGLIKQEEEIPAYSALSDPWANNVSAFRQVSLGDGEYTVSYQERFGLSDEESRININTADSQTLARILRMGAELESDQAEELSFAIMDWRDQDSNYGHPNYGAEDKDYADLKKPYFCKDAPFETPDELLLVKGINRDIFDRIKRFISVYGSGAININTASKEVLLLSGFGDVLMGKILAYRQGEDGEDGTADDRIFMQSQAIASDLDKILLLNVAEKGTLESAVTSTKLDVVSNFFLARVLATEAGGATLEVDAVINRKGKVMYSRFYRVQWPS